MKCPKCGTDTTKTKHIILNTTISNKGESVRRRRKCNHCGCLFTTREFTSDAIGKLLTLKDLMLSETKVNDTDSFLDNVIEDLKTGITNIRRVKNTLRNHVNSREDLLMNLKGQHHE